MEPIHATLSFEDGAITVWGPSKLSQLTFHFDEMRTDLGCIPRARLAFRVYLINFDILRYKWLEHVRRIADWIEGKTGIRMDIPGSRLPTDWTLGWETVDTPTKAFYNIRDDHLLMMFEDINGVELFRAPVTHAAINRFARSLSLLK